MIVVIEFFQQDNKISNNIINNKYLQHLNPPFPHCTASKIRILIAHHKMHNLQNLTTQNRSPQLVYSTEQNSYRNSFRSSHSKSRMEEKKESDLEQEGLEKFGKTYFKSKMGKINELKFSKTNSNAIKHQQHQQQQLERFVSTTPKHTRVNNKSNKSRDNNGENSLQKIDEKFLNYIKNNKATFERYKLINNLSFSPENAIQKYSMSMKSPITNERIKMHLEKQKLQQLHEKQHKQQQQQISKMGGSQPVQQHECYQKIHSYSTQLKQQSIRELLQPISLKKKINLLKKHKQVMQHQFHRRKASLQFQQRSVIKQSKKLSAYRSKFQRMINARRQRSLQRMLNAKQIQQHDRQIMQEKYYMRSTVLNAMGNLQSSRLSLQMEKIQLANETREQSKVMMEEVKEFQNYTLKEKKKRCESVKTSKIKTQQSVEQFNIGKRMTINQRKLQQISQQLNSLQQQKHMYTSFYRQKDENQLYRSRIKQRKDDILKKSKMYKINLMLQLNRNDRLKIKNQQQNQIIQLKNSTTTEFYRKKRHTLSTQPDFNLLTTAKNNAIYKRWGNSILSNRRNDEHIQS